MAYGQALESSDVAQALALSLEIFTAGDRDLAQVNPAALERTRALSAPLFARPPAPQAVAEDLQPPAFERLGEIHAPTLAIVGDNDNRMLPDIAALIAARVRGARSVIIPDAGHHPNLEHPEEFNQIVADFLGQTG
jgi:pimeloyl-ACP methyl ester carboxylesterase